MTPDDKRRISKLSRQAVAKFDELCALVAAARGCDTDLNKLGDKYREAIVDEVERLIDDWDQKSSGLYPATPLNVLLEEHQELCDQIWQIRDDS